MSIDALRAAEAYAQAARAAPARETAPPASSFGALLNSAIAETASALQAGEAAAAQVAAGEANLVDAAIACPVLDSRNWKASTAPAGDGHSLTIDGEIDLPTPGYALIWRAGIADRAMPPGLRVHLDAVPPADLVMQVVTPTLVSWSMDSADERYRVVYVLCGEEAIAEIADVGPKTE